MVFPRGSSFANARVSCLKPEAARQRVQPLQRVWQMSCHVGKPTMWFPNRSDTNLLVQAQKQARSLKFCSLVEEEMYYPSSENKGADQLRGYREADLRLCFRICRLLVFP